MVVDDPSDGAQPFCQGVDVGHAGAVSLPGPQGVQTLDVVKTIGAAERRKFQFRFARSRRPYDPLKPFPSPSFQTRPASRRAFLGAALGAGAAGDKAVAAKLDGQLFGEQIGEVLADGARAWYPGAGSFMAAMRSVEGASKTTVL